MLVLTRQEGQSVFVTTEDGDTMAISVEEVKGGRVKIGFEGDRRKFGIVRGEVKERWDEMDRQREVQSDGE